VNGFTVHNPKLCKSYAVGMPGKLIGVMYGECAPDLVCLDWEGGVPSHEVLTRRSNDPVGR
jgi:hypothetical protein